MDSLVPLQIGRVHLVLVEGVATKQPKDLDQGGGTVQQNIGDEDSREEGGEEGGGGTPRRWWTGRTDTNKRVVFVDASVAVTVAPAPADDPVKVMGLDGSSLVFDHTILEGIASGRIAVQGNKAAYKSTTRDEKLPSVQTSLMLTEGDGQEGEEMEVNVLAGGRVSKGCYVLVLITGGRGHTLRGRPLALASLSQAHRLDLPSLRLPSTYSPST